MAMTPGLNQGAWQYPGSFCQGAWQGIVSGAAWTGTVFKIANPAKVFKVAAANISKVYGVSSS